ncbi:cytochrome c oxidase accessory protein CcoG [Kangiella sediminilitoris]|uniref:Cytochrome c oxidase accessory protein CcoG n=1 Tax=Kangiella sediminilitoris TaxID=1144748 RepID=A0A1B3BCQ7_9GAMM|nr:cytochrome c oxidase accessory protein CcoG [Kangiella sediminilitoris]AOE50600.1 Cytochrome c oxidase accessory protein CcoG [Kangiella sediminilitoris]
MSDENVYVVGDETSLYQKRQKIFPKIVSGKFNNFRVLSAWLLLGLYYLMPWVTWNGQQAILFDLPARKFQIFGLTFWPQDFIFLTMLLIIAALALFFFTAVAGRLWCGYACPQTVWTEAFLWMERLVEGDRNKQIKLDKAPWSFRKVRLRFTKHVLWILFALFTGYTFVGYFTPIRELTESLWTLSFSGWEWFWILFYSFATWGNAGMLREQVCIYMCPYARFQSSMFDKDTLIIAYDEKRGEKRGARKKSLSKEEYQSEGLGDCIDCMQCVHVCPTGIDIRDGLQYECIACAACIDACDDVMEKMGYEKNLIRYTSENHDAGGELNPFRPKTIGYGLILMLMAAIFVLSVWMRTPLELDIIKDRNRLYLTNSEGFIVNIYKLRVLNKDQSEHTYKISVSGYDGIEYEGPQQVTLSPESTKEVPVRVAIDPYLLKSTSMDIEFQLESIDDKSIEVTQPASFIGPVQRRGR